MTSTSQNLPIGTPSYQIGSGRDAARKFLREFSLPTKLEADHPIEAEGLPRDAVRLQVASSKSGISEGKFSDLPRFLREGDVLVANDSATLPAALEGFLRDKPVRVHVSAPLPDSSGRLVEIRLPAGIGSAPFRDGRVGDVIELVAGGSVRLEAARSSVSPGAVRLWEATFHLPTALYDFLRNFGQPIRYGYVRSAWPLSNYQTAFARALGSSEMPSAGRPFTPNLIRRLKASGIRICTITLHTGVSSLESHEPPYAEPFNVSADTAALINRARAEGARVIAVGTTVTRALETCTDSAGKCQSLSGFTDIVITSSRSVRSVDGLITGWHEPLASHLQMLEAIAGPELLAAGYQKALESGNLWHEFGDSQLLLP
jgi:S-adenosylmethionine:tRNA ribosyltransferase-isomerase